MSVAKQKFHSVVGEARAREEGGGGRERGREGEREIGRAPG